MPNQPAPKFAGRFTRLSDVVAFARLLAVARRHRAAETLALAAGLLLLTAAGCARPAPPLPAPTETDFAAGTPRSLSGLRPWTAY